MVDEERSHTALPPSGLFGGVEPVLRSHQRPIHVIETVAGRNEAGGAKDGVAISCDNGRSLFEESLDRTHKV